MPQKFGLYEELTVMENLKLYARLRSMDATELNATFAELLRFTRLEPFVETTRRQAVRRDETEARSRVRTDGEPAVLLLDEPSVGVDPVSRQDLWRMVKALTHDGMAVVWSTAYLDEAERCDTVLLLNDGRIEFDGPPRNSRARRRPSLSPRRFRENRRGILSEMLDLPAYATASFRATPCGRCSTKGRCCRCATLRCATAASRHRAGPLRRRIHRSARWRSRRPLGHRGANGRR